MLYLSGATPPNLRPEIERLGWGYMLAPRAGRRIGLVAEIPWAADNGCFSAVWDEGSWVTWLDDMKPVQPTCLFAVAPDVVGDADATRARWEQYHHIPLDLGYRVAFVAQDGQDQRTVPWNAASALFVGGVDCPLCAWRKARRQGAKPQPTCTCFKISEAAFDLAREAKRRGLWTHMGRVNSQRRVRAAYAGSYDSADGTYMAFNPKGGIARIGEFLLRQRLQHPLAL